MSWFQRKDKNIKTPTSQKRDSPDMWFKTPGGTTILKNTLGNDKISMAKHQRLPFEKHLK